MAESCRMGVMMPELFVGCSISLNTSLSSHPVLVLKVCISLLNIIMGLRRQISSY